MENGDLSSSGLNSDNRCLHEPFMYDGANLNGSYNKLDDKEQFNGHEQPYSYIPKKTTPHLHIASKKRLLAIIGILCLITSGVIIAVQYGITGKQSISTLRTKPI